MSLFLSTLSLRRATPGIDLLNVEILFLSTLSLRRATHPIGVLITVIEISIHALLAESDKPRILLNLTFHYFYPRSPCGERRDKGKVEKKRLVFLSTLSLRRATRTMPRIATINRHFYPRSPCGERQQVPAVPKRPKHHFYPRSPCGERLIKISFPFRPSIFLSTLSLRRATVAPGCKSFRNSIFLSTLSLRRATLFRQNYECFQWIISIHALLAESDPATRRHDKDNMISIHALLAESDTWQRGSRVTYVEFLSTLSLRRATT